MSFCITQSEYLANPDLYEVVSGPSDSCSACGVTAQVSAGSDVRVPVAPLEGSNIEASVIFSEVSSAGGVRFEVFGQNDSENFYFRWTADAQYVGDIIFEFKIPDGYTLEDFNNFRVFQTGYTADNYFSVQDITILAGPYAPDYATRRVYGLGAAAAVSMLAAAEGKSEKNVGVKRIVPKNEHPAADNEVIYPGDCESGVDLNSSVVKLSTCCRPSVFAMYNCICLDCPSAVEGVQTGAKYGLFDTSETKKEYACSCNCDSDKYWCGGECRDKSYFKCGDDQKINARCECDCNDSKKIACRKKDGTSVCIDTCNGIGYELEDCVCKCGGMFEMQNCKKTSEENCGLKCGDGREWDEDSCECKCRNKCEGANEEVKDDCSCGCGPGYERCGGECRRECPSLQVRNPETCACDCVGSQDCPNGQVRDPISCECKCERVLECKGVGQHFDDYSCACVCDADNCECNNRGKCPGDKIYGKWTDGCPCLCPEGKYECGADRCVDCPDYDSQTCDCPCPAGQTRCGGVCRPDCGAGKAYDGSCKCKCEGDREECTPAGGTPFCYAPCSEGEVRNEYCMCVPATCEDITFNGQKVSGSFVSSECLYEVTCYQCSECPKGRTRQISKETIDGKGCSDFKNQDTGQDYVSDCAHCSSSSSPSGGSSSGSSGDPCAGQNCGWIADKINNVWQLDNGCSDGCNCEDPEPICGSVRDAVGDLCYTPCYSPMPSFMRLPPESKVPRLSQDIFSAVESRPNPA